MVAIARSNLCGILTELGALDGAEELGRLALASDIARYGEQHPYAGIRQMRVEPGARVRCVRTAGLPADRPEVEPRAGE
jgi:hypothetical protein